ANAATSTRLVGPGAGGSDRGSRLPISFHRSGGTYPSMSRRWPFKSVIFILQEPHQTSPPAMEVHSGRRRSHTQDGCNLPHRSIGVVVQKDRSTLVVRQLAQKGNEF